MLEIGLLDQIVFYFQSRALFHAIDINLTFFLKIVHRDRSLFLSFLNFIQPAFIFHWRYGKIYLNLILLVQPDY